MLVCIRDVATTYDGQVEVLRAGRDRVRHNHPIVRRFPDRFRPLTHSETRTAPAELPRGVIRVTVPPAHRTP